MGDEPMKSGAVVLAGGGVAGIAWEVGILLGITDVEPDAAARLLGPHTTLVGTSAGSVVASQLAGEVPLVTLFEQQLAEDSAEIGARFDAAEFGRSLEKLLAGVTTPEEGRRRVGRFALDARTVSAEERREVISSRLSVQHWTDRDLRITAVDAETGELRVFDRRSGVDLLDAVGASCAVPGIWPTVQIDGRSYTDGGVRSIANADLAAGSDPVLILAPLPEENGDTAITPAELGALEPARVRVVFADAASVAAFGSNPLDPATRAESANAGRAQGRRIATEIAGFLG